ncbi:nose resistant to fluoxetine protein 6-like isoform X3 [Dermacentor albipictus]|uniref:nose resistant to fluoxetine protein 6-like isoform X3 n=1 Tax=Dermacentor albipictus TaxID=60249 RepID=UPI0031FDD661
MHGSPVFRLRVAWLYASQPSLPRLQVFDASGKYPTGLFQGSHVDLGAFDECLETMVLDGSGHVTSRGQYCNLQFYVKNSTAWQKKMEPMLQVMDTSILYFKKYFFLEELPIVRLGICALDDCSQDDLQALVDSVKPSVLDIEVSNCLTIGSQPWSATQKSIVILLGFLVIAVVGSTSVDLFIQSRRKLSGKHSALIGLATAFSAVANTQVLFKVADKANADHYPLQFLHGLRFFSLAYIVMGHSYQTMSDTWSRLQNMFAAGNYWPNMMIAAAFSSVDTFFFLSGFFLCLSLVKQESNGPHVFIIGVLRRIIRICVPLFFTIMCFYVVPLFSTGPDTKSFFLKLYDDVEENWWRLLLQIRNFFELTPKTILGHTWYLSADFQLFLISLLVLLLFRRRKTLAVGAFVLLSFMGCAYATWTISGSDLTPFVVFPTETPQVVMRTVNKYYIRPFYHAVCYFSGCIAFLVIDDIKERKISKGVQLVGWCLATACCLCCIFMKHAWYANSNPTSEAGKLFTAFFDRVLWSLFLSWITLACSTGRGGVLSNFLSYNAFVPLSKLSFGVYLIHFPFIQLMLHASRERIFWSHFNQITLFFALLVWSFLLAYLAYLVCEGPTAFLDKLAFQRLTRRGRPSGNQAQEPRLDCSAELPEKKAENGRVISQLTSGKMNGYTLSDPGNGAVRGLSWRSQWVPQRL